MRFLPFQLPIQLPISRVVSVNACVEIVCQMKTWFRRYVTLIVSCELRVTRLTISLMIYRSFNPVGSFVSDRKQIVKPRILLVLKAFQKISQHRRIRQKVVQSFSVQTRKRVWHRFASMRTVETVRLSTKNLLLNLHHRSDWRCFWVLT